MAEELERQSSGQEADDFVGRGEGEGNRQEGKRGFDRTQLQVPGAEASDMEDEMVDESPPIGRSLLSDTHALERDSTGQ